MKQRWTVATFAGVSAASVAGLMGIWPQNSDHAALDRFSAAVREKGPSLPIVYFCEWIDHWLMGNVIPGPEKLDGQQDQAACCTPAEALAWAEQCGSQFREQEWLACRLREAAHGWFGSEPRTIVAVREVLGASETDEEVRASFAVVPGWLERLT